MGRRPTIADDDILAAAHEAFVEYGLAASTRDIARRAGVSEGVLFQRHGTKANLFFAAMAPPPFRWDRVFSARRLREDGRARLEALVAVFERLGAHGRRFPEVLVRGAVASIWRGFAPAPARQVKTRRRDKRP